MKRLSLKDDGNGHTRDGGMCARGTRCNKARALSRGPKRCAECQGRPTVTGYMVGGLISRLPQRLARCRRPQPLGKGSEGQAASNPPRPCDERLKPTCFQDPRVNSDSNNTRTKVPCNERGGPLRFPIHLKGALEIRAELSAVDWGPHNFAT